MTLTAIIPGASKATSTSTRKPLQIYMSELGANSENGFVVGQ